MDDLGLLEKIRRCRGLDFGWWVEVNFGPVQRMTSDTLKLKPSNSCLLTLNTSARPSTRT